MIISTTAVAQTGAVNIWVPIALKVKSRLKAVAVGDLTTANQVAAIYLAPAKFITITQDAAMPNEVLAESCCLKSRSQASLSDRITWRGDIEIDKWATVIAGLFVNCTVGDRVQVAVEVEDAQ